MTPLFGGVEAGGTKFVLGIGTAAGGSIATARVATRDPDATLADVAAFFAAHRGAGPLAGIGLASFGPIDLAAGSATFGHILATPKPGWAGTDIVGRIGRDAGLPVAVETDVNAAAIAEARLGAGRGAGDLAYVTVGTGVGIGLVSGGRPVHGIGHPEGGHLLVRRHPAHGAFAGICPYHGDCLEGLASGPAIRAAWGAGLDALPPDHPAWEVEADYLAQACVALILMLAPAAIVLGGGVMGQAALLPAIRARTAALLAGYDRAGDEAALARRIVAPGCGEPPGLLGAYLIAEDAARRA